MFGNYDTREEALKQLKALAPQATDNKKYKGIWSLAALASARHKDDYHIGILFHPDDTLSASRNPRSTMDALAKNCRKILKQAGFNGASILSTEKFYFVPAFAGYFEKGEAKDFIRDNKLQKIGLNFTGGISESSNFAKTQRAVNQILEGKDIRKVLSRVSCSESKGEEDYQFIADLAEKAAETLPKFKVELGQPDTEGDTVTVDPKKAEYFIDWYGDGYALGVSYPFPDVSDMGDELDWGVNVVDDEDIEIVQNLLDRLPDSVKKYLDTSDGDSDDGSYFYLIKGSDE